MAELKTTDNKLSLWRVENEADIKDALVALAITRDKISDLAVVMIRPEDLQELSMDDEEGNSPTFGINDKHRNITNLNYDTLGTVIISILNGLRSGGYKKHSDRAIKRMIVEAYKAGKVDLSNAKESMREDIEKALQSNVMN